MNLPITSTADITAVKNMSRADRDALEERIKTTDPHSIFKSAGETRNADKRKIICPNCSNGTGDSKTPVEAVRKDGGIWLYNCFKCNAFHGNLFGIIADAANLNPKGNFEDTCKTLAIGANLIGYPLPAAQTVKHKPQPIDDEKKEREERLKKINDVISEAQKNLPEFIKACSGTWRGLTGGTLRHFHCGYLPLWHHSKKCSTSPRVIIPAEVAPSTANYLARLTIPLDSIPADEHKWIQEKEHDGEKTLFNRDAIIGADRLVVVEGYIDAMTLWQAFEEKIKVVALGGKNGGQLVTDVLRAQKQKPKTIVLFDADATETAENLRGELVKIGVPAVNRIFDDVMTDTDKQAVGGKIDANSILVALGADKLKDYTESILTAAQIDFKAVEEKIARDAELKKRLDDWQRDRGKINPDTLGKLKTALDALNALTPETFTVADVDKHKQNAALALTYGFRETAEKYFKTIKAAKEIARNRISESDSDLTKKLSADELNALTALAEGVDINSLRREVDREVTALDKAHKDFIKAENARIAKEKREKAREIRAIEITNAEERLKQLKAMEPSKERDAELVDVIRQLCEWKHNKYGEPVAVAGTQANLDLMLAHDPVADGLFGFDEFAQTDVFLKSAPWNKKAKKGDEWTDADDAQLQTYLRRYYTEFANKDLFRNTFVDFSRERSFHEVKDYFHNLPKWDGKPRAETLFIDFLKADDTPYVREVTLNWLTAAVCRIFYPGCDYQIAPILLGKQGIGKSHITRRLFGKWYIVLSDAVDDPHAIDAIQKGWGIEVKEMAAMKKDVDANKRFIDSAEDTRRFAYDRRARTIKRHCVFIITSNNQQLLSDLTGNRRYPVIACHATQHGADLTDDFIKQLWAEVFAHCNELFKDGFDERKLELSNETKKIVGEVAEQYLNDNGMTGMIEAFLNTKILPTVIWDLLSKEERRQYFKDGGEFVIDESALIAKFKASRKNIPAELQADFDAAVKSSDAVIYKDVRNKLTGEITTHIAFYGAEYRQHICAAEVKTECFDKADRRATSQAINEILANFDTWNLGERIQKAPVYGDQRKVYYRAADNAPADEPPATEPPTDTPTSTDTAFEKEKVDEPDFDLSQFDE